MEGRVGDVPSDSGKQIELKTEVISANAHHDTDRHERISIRLGLSIVSALHKNADF